MCRPQPWPWNTLVRADAGAHTVRGTLPGYVGSSPADPQAKVRGARRLPQHSPRRKAQCPGRLEALSGSPWLEVSGSHREMPFPASCGQKPWKTEGAPLPSGAILTPFGNSLASAHPGETHVHSAGNYGSSSPGYGAKSPNPTWVLWGPLPRTVPPNTQNG